MIKKTLILLLVFSMILSTGMTTFADGSIQSFGNEFEIDTEDEFSYGEVEDVSVDGSIGNGAITLVKDKTDGIYTSQEIEVPNFEYMVVCWNSDTPEGTYVEVQARVFIQPLEKWTNWLSWGEWSPFIKRASSSTVDELAEISVDELIVKGSNGETANKVQLKVILHSDNDNITPTVRYLHGTLKNTLDGQTIEKEFRNPEDISNLDKNIATPALSQMIRDPKIASSICSPTTITMIMNGKGEELLPEEVAQNTYDFNYGFGNWAFAMASVGSYGYQAYADYTTIEGLKQEIAKGYPVGVSVKYSNDPKQTAYPYVEGAPGITGGHLIVVTGFDKDKDGNEYVLVNDSYAPENDTVSRKYKLEQFEEAWSRSKNMAYIVHEKEDGAGNACTKRIEAELVESDKSKAYYISVDGEIINIDNFDGTVAYTLDDNNEFNDIEYEYFSKFKNIKNSLIFKEKEFSDSHLKLYAITDIGYVYVIEH